MLLDRWKIGFKDGSGTDEFWITDENDKVIVHGQGDCCRTGGIQELETAKQVVREHNYFVRKDVTA